MGFWTYAQYCARRGYKPPFKGWPVVRRSLFESWTEPGFHRFWRVWNPPVGYPLFCLYRLLGGNRNRVFATLAVFTVTGALHDLAVVALQQRWGVVLTFAYFAFGCLSLISTKLAAFVGQERWPKILNVLVNAGLVVGILEVSMWSYWNIAPWRI
jgi:hypothetical protein